MGIAVELPTVELIASLLPVCSHCLTCPPAAYCEDSLADAGSRSGADRRAHLRTTP